MGDREAQRIFNKYTRPSAPYHSIWSNSSNKTRPTSCNDTIRQCKYSSCKMMLKSFGPEILEPRGLEPKWLRTIQQYLSYVHMIIWPHDHMITWSQYGHMTTWPYDHTITRSFDHTIWSSPKDHMITTMTIRPYDHHYDHKNIWPYDHKTIRPYDYFLYSLITHMIWPRSRYSTKWSILMG